MKIAFISTYPPRKCGLATFCENMIIHFRNEMSVNDQIDVFALGNSENINIYTAPVRQVIHENKPKDYHRAAATINSEYSACFVQFEHGIYGGNGGIYLLQLLARVKIPIISILHTVLKSPSFHQRLVVSQVAHYSTKVVVMAKMAIGFLVHSYGVDSNKIIVIEHGLPDYENQHLKVDKNSYGWKGQNILMTFGLISEGKGFEYVIQALPAIIQIFPNTLFVIIGQTHPRVAKREGELYRKSLIQQIDQLKLQEHVLFINRHVSEEELMNYLSVSDIYVCPYLNETQITSGTLSYALGSGTALIATPFWHSKELCDEGYILNVPFKDHRLLANMIIELFENPDLLKTYKEKATQYGYGLSWPKIAQRYLQLTNKLLHPATLQTKSEKFPGIDFTYIRTITDRKGIMQHADHNKINYQEGYCVDDNARALLCLLKYQKEYQTSKHSDLIEIYFNFIERSQDSSGRILNFATYPDLTFLSDYSEDTVGRAIWALAYLLNSPNQKRYHQRARQIIDRASPHVSNLQHIRGMANCLIGYTLLKDSAMVNLLANKISKQYTLTKKQDWPWFENGLTYDNGILPLSLLYAYELTANRDYLHIAIHSLNFLNSIYFQHNYLSLIGNNGWYAYRQNRSFFSQQPIDAMASTLVNSKAFELTTDETYRKFALKSMEWFYGKNILSAPLYDPLLKSCHDGINPMDISENQGAESTIVYLIARIETKKLIVHKPVNF